MIVKDLNDSQNRKHTLFCREIVFVAIYALFSDNKCPLFTRLGGGGRPKRTLSAFFTVFLIGRLPLSGIVSEKRQYIDLNRDEEHNSLQQMLY